MSEQLTQRGALSVALAAARCDACGELGAGRLCLAGPRGDVMVCPLCLSEISLEALEKGFSVARAARDKIEGR